MENPALHHDSRRLSALVDCSACYGNPGLRELANIAVGSGDPLWSLLAHNFKARLVTNLRQTADRKLACVGWLTVCAAQGSFRLSSGSTVLLGTTGPACHWMAT